MGSSTMSLTLSELLLRIHSWLLEPILIGCLSSALLAVILAMHVDPVAMEGAAESFHALALRVALALSAWRICVRPALMRLHDAATDMGRNADD